MSTKMFDVYIIILLQCSMVELSGVSSANSTDLGKSVNTMTVLESSSPLLETSSFPLSSFQSTSILSPRNTIRKDSSFITTNQSEGSFSTTPESTGVFNISISQLERLISSSFHESIEISATEIIATGISKLPEGTHTSFWSFLDDSSSIIPLSEKHITSSFVDHSVTPPSVIHSSVLGVINSKTDHELSSSFESSFSPITSSMFMPSEDISSATTVDSAAVSEASKSIVLNKTSDIFPSPTSASEASTFQLFSLDSFNIRVNSTEIVMSPSLSQAQISDMSSASTYRKHEMASVHTISRIPHSSSLSDIRSNSYSQYPGESIYVSSSSIQADYSFVSSMTDSRMSISSSYPNEVKIHSSSMVNIQDKTDIQVSSQFIKSSVTYISTIQSGETSTHLPDEIPISTFTTTIASFDTVTVQLQFDGICETIRRAGKMAGIEYFVDLGLLLQKEFNLSKEQITPKKIACNPVQIIFELRIQPAAKLQIIRKRLTSLVENGKVSFPIFVDGKMVFFNASKIVFNPHFANNEGSYSRIGLSEIDIIVISAVCSASMILVCIGFIICAREYYGKYRTRSFDLSEIDWNSKVDDYTLTKIPRPKVTYSENGMKLHSIGKTSGKDMREKSSEEENETLVSSVRLRVNTDENGLTVGVTGRNFSSSNQSSPSHSYHSCDNRDASRELLVRPRDSPLHSVDNPIYYADDERFHVD